MNERVRALDVVVYGATGFTGRLVAEHLANADTSGLKWAIAGRNREKLEALRTELASNHPELATLPIRVADAHDITALDTLTRETRVVATTAGPFAEYGMDLGRACARNGTSYCDLAGEPHFIRQLIDETHELAQKTGARIVPCCGYDSIPSDLGVYLAWDYAQRTLGEGLAWAKVFTGRTRGRASGGTIASGIGILQAATRSAAVRRLLRNPHGFDPDPEAAPRDPFERDQLGVRWDPDLERWTAPFVMSSTNARVVRRSNALLEGYGAKFRYHEAMSFRRGPRGLLTASQVTAGLGVLLAASLLPPTRLLLQRAVLPAPGEGPTREAIETGYFEMHVLAETEASKTRLRGRVGGSRDPGYGATAIMLGEAALCLARDEGLEKRFGVLTPASAMGRVLIQRLRAAGMTFEMATS